MSIKELIEKNPSDSSVIYMLDRGIDEIKYNGGNVFRAISPDENLKNSFLNKEVKAVSYRNGLYLNCLHFECRKWFSKVETEGKYLGFYGATTKGGSILQSIAINTFDASYPPNAPDILKPVSIPISRKVHVYVLDTENGTSFKLSAKKMPEFLKDFKVLLELWNSIDTNLRDNQTILSFVMKVNEIYRSK